MSDSPGLVDFAIGLTFFFFPKFFFFGRPKIFQLESNQLTQTLSHNSKACHNRAIWRHCSKKTNLLFYIVYWYLFIINYYLFCIYNIAIKLTFSLTAVIYTDSLCIVIFPYWIIFDPHTSQCNLWGDSGILVMLLQFTKHFSNCY